MIPLKARIMWHLWHDAIANRNQHARNQFLKACRNPNRLLKRPLPPTPNRRTP